ncbi:NADP-dependent oxidoreductase [Dictyobacter aurantiacus]|uniref:NADPH:quinone reductase n=1 Tax=Dictyobacter aurantiacus TaxID=1936993 RepID=A0A401ZMS9_9CHLR|nr:NADP-dependent oxidoreductase [Dictyobacter aurantiacus]GCE08165.1 NADPH:quinone reductase [Dictyobacter aurantiacus]
MSEKMMQAIQVRRYGGPEELVLESIPRPQPGEGEVLVRVHAAGVLPIEWKVRQGLFKSVRPSTFPYIPGSAFSGIIAEVGPGVTAFNIGQEVFGRSNNGAYAEYTIAEVETLALKPEQISFEEAATISGGATVAWSALFENADLQPGQRVLVHAAAGGVGLFAVQFAHWRGAQVIGTASAANARFVSSLGADIVIDYTRTPFEGLARNVDVVLDTMGGEVLERSMRVVKRGGILITLLGQEPSQQETNRLGIRAMRNAPTFPFPSTSLLQNIARLMATGQIRTTIARTFPLSEASEAHALSETGHGRGRIMLKALLDRA